MMNKLIVANLTNRPVRSIISIVAIALEVTLILLIVGFSLGTLNDARNRQAGIGADVIVLPPGSANIVTFSGAPMPAKIGDLIAKLPHVAVVSPALIQISMAGSPQNVYGIDFDTYQALRPFTFLKGGPFSGPDDLLVDDVYIHGKNLTVGNEVTLLNHKFRISGVVAHGKGARLYVPLSTMQDITGAPSRATIFYVKADDPANTDTIAGEIKAIPHMETYNVYSMREWLSMMTPDNVPMLSTFIHIVIGISVTIGVIVIFQAMYAAVMERTREIGILKSLGASKLYIVNAILRETALLAIGGIVVGIAISFAASLGIRRGTTLPVQITGSWLAYATIIAIIGALAGALYPAFKAAEKDPIDALAYE
ncbi:MAG TPA: FtsX-like permease family protein [Terriglobales bacterium]|nr:FtsX-like permease family protein [Terriglobales bacterium]